MDWANWSTARKILLPASLLFLLDSFLSWQKVCGGAGAFKVCGSQSMWHGLGFLIGLLLIALIVWEALQAFSPDTTRNWNLPGGLVTLGLAGAILVLTVIRVLTLDFRHWPAWIGLILALAIGYAGWLRFRESGETLPSRASMGGGSSTGTGTSGSTMGGSGGSMSGTTTGGAGEGGGMGTTGGMGTSPSAGTSGAAGGGMGAGTSDMGTTGGSDMGTTGGSTGMGGGTSAGSQEETPPA